MRSIDRAQRELGLILQDSPVSADRWGHYRPGTAGTQRSVRRELARSGEAAEGVEELTFDLAEMLGCN